MNNRVIQIAVALAWAGVSGACGADEMSQSPTTVQPTPTAGAAGQAAPVGGAGSSAPRAAGAPAAGSPGKAAVSKPAAPAAGAAGAAETGDVVVSPKPTDAGPGTGAEAEGPIELPLELTNVDVTNDTTRRFGAPHVAVNPKDPNNIVVLASSNLGYTRACLPATPGSDCEMIEAGIPFLTQPRGFYKTPGFMDIGVYASLDRGKTWKKADTTGFVPPDHPEVRARGEGPIAAMADGSFYIGFNAINWGEWEMQPTTFFPNGGVGVVKSTDGGLTWKWASFSQTPADWPYGGNDLSTNTFYVTSGLAGMSALGSRSTGEPDQPQGAIADRWISSTQDGTTWTTPQPLGAGGEANHVSGGHSSVAAANGIMATMFVASDQASCSTFLEGAAAFSCVVFQTSKDAGATWTRHRVPTPAGYSAQALSVLLGADPTKEGQFTAVLLDEAGSEFLVYVTTDAGATWSEPTRVSEDATKTHFAPWVANSPKGKFGLMWRTYEREGASPGASAPYMPYSVWAAISSDGGATFSKPLKVSKANSPAPPDDPNDSFSFVGDHGPSGMALDDAGGAYVVWADWTTGERSISLAAINQQAFEQ